MFPSLVLAVETMKLALHGIICLGQNVLPLVLEVRHQAVQLQGKLKPKIENLSFRHASNHNLVK